MALDHSDDGAVSIVRAEADQAAVQVPEQDRDPHGQERQDRNDCHRPTGNGDDRERDKADRKRKQDELRIAGQMGAKVEHIVLGLDARRVFLESHGYAFVT